MQNVEFRVKKIKEILAGRRAKAKEKKQNQEDLSKRLLNQKFREWTGTEQDASAPAFLSQDFNESSKSLYLVDPKGAKYSSDYPLIKMSKPEKGPGQSTNLPDLLSSNTA